MEVSSLLYQNDKNTSNVHEATCTMLLNLGLEWWWKVKEVKPRRWWDDQCRYCGRRCSINTYWSCNRKGISFLWVTTYCTVLQIPTVVMIFPWFSNEERSFVHLIGILYVIPTLKKLFSSNQTEILHEITRVLFLNSFNSVISVGVELWPQYLSIGTRVDWLGWSASKFDTSPSLTIQNTTNRNHCRRQPQNLT